MKGVLKIPVTGIEFEGGMDTLGIGTCVYITMIDSTLWEVIKIKNIYAYAGTLAPIIQQAYVLKSLQDGNHVAYIQEAVTDNVALATGGGATEQCAEYIDKQFEELDKEIDTTYKSEEVLGRASSLEIYKVPLLPATTIKVGDTVGYVSNNYNTGLHERIWDSNTDRMIPAYLEVILGTVVSTSELHKTTEVEVKLEPNNMGHQYTTTLAVSNGMILPAQALLVYTV